MLVRSLSWRAKAVSRSIKVWGGEVQAISRDLKSELLSYIFTNLDLNCLGELSLYQFDMLWWLLFRTCFISWSVVCLNSLLR